MCHASEFRKAFEKIATRDSPRYARIGLRYPRRRTRPRLPPPEKEAFRGSKGCEAADIT
jgi:hypothetical protein